MGVVLSIRIGCPAPCSAQGRVTLIVSAGSFLAEKFPDIARIPHANFLGIQAQFREIIFVLPMLALRVGGAGRQIRTRLRLPTNTGTYAEQSSRHSARAAARFSLKLARE